MKQTHLSHKPRFVYAKSVSDTYRHVAYTNHVQHGHRARFGGPCFIDNHNCKRHGI